MGGHDRVHTPGAAGILGREFRSLAVQFVGAGLRPRFIGGLHPDYVAGERPLPPVLPHWSLLDGSPQPPASAGRYGVVAVPWIEEPVVRRARGCGSSHG